MSGTNTPYGGRSSMSGTQTPYGEQHCSMLRLLGDHLNMLGETLKRYGSAQDYESVCSLQKDLRSMATARESPLGEGYVVPGASVDRNKVKPPELGFGTWDLPLDRVRASVQAIDGLRIAAAPHQPIQAGLARKSREEKDGYRPVKLGFSRVSCESSDGHVPVKLRFSSESRRGSEDRKPIKLGRPRDSSTIIEGCSSDAGLHPQDVWNCSTDAEEKVAFKSYTDHADVDMVQFQSLNSRLSGNVEEVEVSQHGSENKDTGKRTLCHTVRDHSHSHHPEHDFHHPLAEQVKMRRTMMAKRRKSNASVNETEVAGRTSIWIFTAQTGEIAIASLIMLNAMILGIQADIQWDAWELFEIFFTLIFTLEMVMKSWFQGCRYYWRGPDCYWNWFDATIVYIAIADFLYSQIVIRLLASKAEFDLNSIMFIKMIRLCRLARMVRLLRFKMFAQLRMMIQGVAAGLQVLFWAIVLLFFFIYVIAIIMNKTVRDEEDPRLKEPFRRVPWSMFTVFLCFTDGCTAHDGTPLQVALYRAYGAKFMIPYVLTFLFVTIGLFNLIMARFVDNVMENTNQRKRSERAGCAESQEKELRSLLVELYKHHGTTQASTYTKAATQSSTQRFSFQQSINTMANNGLQRIENALGLRINRKTEKDDDEEKIVLDRESCTDVFENPKMQSLMDSLEISTCDPAGLFDVLDADQSGELELDEVVVGLMNLRGPAEKTDTVGTLLCVRVIQQILRNFEEDVCNAHDQIFEKVMEMENAIDELRA